MPKYLDKDGLTDYTGKLTAKYKTMFASKADVGTPLVATTAAAMTDTTKIYVYTGSESGYTAGNWYYYNGSAWTSGGVYNSTAVATDKTLTVENKAADGKATGEMIMVNGTSASSTRINITTTSDDVELAEMSDVNDLKNATNDLDGGSTGQVLRKHSASDYDFEWASVGQPTDEQTATAVTAWLNLHPEATTTVDFRVVDKVYNTVAEMVSDNTLDTGDHVQVYGHYSRGDGGNAEYIVGALASGETADNASVVALQNGKVARILKSNTLNFVAFGAKSGDSSFDNSTILQKAITYLYANFPCSNITGGHQLGGGTIFIPAGTYYFLTQINIDNCYNLRICGEDDDSTRLVIRPTTLFATTQNSMGFTAENLLIVSNGLITAGSAHDYTIKRCRFFNMRADSSTFAMSFYLAVNLKILQCTFYNCEKGIILSGARGVGASTTVEIDGCWFSHNGIGFDAQFSNNKLVTLWIHNSIFEYNTIAINLSGNESFGESIGTLESLHFEGNTDAIICYKFSLFVNDLYLADEDTLKITANATINSVKGFLRKRTDISYNSNLGVINVKFDNGTFLDTTYAKDIFIISTRLAFQKIGDAYELRCMSATEGDITSFFTNCKDYLPDFYTRTLFVNNTTSEPVVLSLRKADVTVIGLNPWGALSTYTITGYLRIGAR